MGLRLTRRLHTDVTASISPPGRATAASCLSFGATIAGFALGWTSLAADYTVNFPANSSKLKVFACTYGGLNLPLIFCEVLGAVLMATFTQKSTWEDAYHADELGGLLGAPLIGPMGGFGKFLLVILALSIVANNIRESAARLFACVWMTNTDIIVSRSQPTCIRLPSPSKRSARTPRRSLACSLSSWVLASTLPLPFLVRRRRSLLSLQASSR